ncbi:hypothetical protein MC378_04640 [Polaribacter sp. MSW13]|uniref:MORN repeat protein n=1 Tax=Polaribacter marinus TaxID=2916838 RepID=A0A9X1VPU3_9FLAO|nr:hypothetical protein [Polaribacter marinus]MCI2228445.1 hypothetical protein [Polaribacter marinus]
MIIAITMLLFTAVKAQKVVKEYYNNGQLKAIGKQYSAEEIVFKNKQMNKLYKASTWLQPKPQKVGEWKWYYDNGELKTKGFYSEGKRKDKTVYTYKDKKWEEYLSNGKLASTGYYKKGDKDGVWEYFLKNEVKYYKTFKRNKENGEYKYFDKDKNVRAIGYYINKKKDGKWKFYSENGLLILFENYKGGKLVGDRVSYFSNGKPKESSFYINGLQAGEVKAYHENGQLYTEARYVNGVHVGEQKWYKENGDLDRYAKYYGVTKNASKISNVKVFEIYKFKRDSKPETHVHLKFSKVNRGSTLGEPGASSAFYLIDDKGKKYNLIGQTGWKGDKVEGFGWLSKPIRNLSLKLKFEEVPLENIKTLNLIEGNCTGRNCWHIYNILSSDSTDNLESDRCVSGDCTNGKGTYKWNTGETYTGEFRYGKRNGKGTNIFKNGDKYVGEFNRDEMHGYGAIMYFKNGDKFQGTFEYNKMDYGTLILKDGTIRKGNWKNKKQEGKGATIFKNGDEYNGEYKKGLKHGFGVFKWSNGDIYKGLWKNDVREGNGVFSPTNGAIYKGKWKNDEQEDGVTYSHPSEKKNILNRYFNGTKVQKYSSREKKQIKKESFEKIVSLLKRATDLYDKKLVFEAVDDANFKIVFSSIHSGFGMKSKKYSFLDFKTIKGFYGDYWESGEFKSNLFFDNGYIIRTDYLNTGNRGKEKRTSSFETFEFYYDNKIFDVIELENEIERFIRVK